MRLETQLTSGCGDTDFIAILGFLSFKVCYIFFFNHTYATIWKKKHQYSWFIKSAIVQMSPTLHHEDWAWLCLIDSDQTMQ